MCQYINGCRCRVDVELNASTRVKQVPLESWHRPSDVVETSRPWVPSFGPHGLSHVDLYILIRRSSMSGPSASSSRFCEFSWSRLVSLSRIVSRGDTGWSTVGLFLRVSSRWKEKHFQGFEVCTIPGASRTKMGCLFVTVLTPRD
jgi:hypothetical protein